MPQEQRSQKSLSRCVNAEAGKAPQASQNHGTSRQGNQTDLSLIPALPPTSCVAPGSPPPLSEQTPHSSYLGGPCEITLRGLCKGKSCIYIYPLQYATVSLTIFSSLVLLGGTRGSERDEPHLLSHSEGERGRAGLSPLGPTCSPHHEVEGR